MKKISFFVIIVHLFLAFWFTKFEKQRNKIEMKKLSVNHFSIKKTQKPALKTAVSSPKEKPKTSAPPPQKKIQTKPAPTTKQPLIAPQKQTKSPVAQKLMRELEESIAKIEGNRDKVDTGKQLKVPDALKPLKIESHEEILSEKKYAEMLILCLKESLNLPDLGEVKIKITLRQDGSVEQLTVLNAESESNRRYLEMHLPHIQFPALKKTEHTFVLTFCNEV